MFDARDIWKNDLVLRIAGGVSLSACWFLMRWLFHSPNLGRHHDPTFVELIAAGAGFLCFSAGAALATLGAHLFDQVELSERWVRRPSASPERETRR